MAPAASRLGLRRAIVSGFEFSPLLNAGERNA
jgi:hypothetical protein